MDMSKLRFGEMIAAVAGAVLFIDMFLPWYKASNGATSISNNAWEAFQLIDLLLLLVVVISVGLAVLTATGKSLSLPVPASLLTAVSGAVVFVLLFYRLIDLPNGFSLANISVNVPNDDISRQIGLFIGLIASGAVAVGGWQLMREEGTTLGS